MKPLLSPQYDFLQNACCLDPSLLKSASNAARERTTVSQGKASKRKTKMNTSQNTSGAKRKLAVLK